MPRGFWNPWFGSAWGGAAAGAAQAGRGATLGQILALAAMGSSEGLYRQQEFEEERERRRLEEEERRAEREMREEEHRLRLQEAQARAAERERETSAGNVADEFAMSEAFDVGPRNDVMPPAAFAQPGQFADYWAGEAKSDMEAARKARRAEWAAGVITEKGGVPTGEADLDISVAESIFKESFKEDKTSFTERKYWAERAERDEQEELDSDWSSWFNYESGQPALAKKLEQDEQAKKEAEARKKEANEAWDKQYSEYRNDAEKRLGRLAKSETLDSQAEVETIKKLGPRPTPKRPVPAAKQSLNPSLTGLPPAGGKVAPPTGSAPPPVAAPPPKKKPAEPSVNVEAAIQRELAFVPVNQRAAAEAELRAAYASGEWVP